MEQPFALVVGRLQRLLGAASLKLEIQIRFALMGGLAVSAWGAIRATQDIDLLADSDPSPIGSRPVRDKLRQFFQENDCAVEWRVGESDDPIPLLLRLNLGGPLSQPGADILWAHRRWHQAALQRRLEVRAGRLRISVLHPEDLILMKLDAGGPQDLLDVQALLSCRPPELNIDRLKKMAARLRLGRALARCQREIEGP
jgi:hypothetical protein